MIITQYIKDHFGSKRGLLRACFAEAARFLGCHKKFNNIDFTKVNRIVFICHGNICRSPLGEAVAKAHGVESVSYGLDTRGEDNADPRALAYGDANGIEFSQHKSQHIKNYQPRSTDLLVGMEPRHTSQLISLYGDKVQITLIGLWLNNPISYLHDPYNANIIFFKHCESLVVQGAEQLATNIKQKAFA